MPRRHTYVTLAPGPTDEDLADALRGGATLVRVGALTRPTSRMCLTVRSTAFSAAQEKVAPCPCRRRPLLRPKPIEVGLAGSRFWVLVVGCSGKSCLSDMEASSSSSPSAYPRSGPERITLDGFVDKAWAWL
jgi:hypothetical protein